MRQINLQDEYVKIIDFIQHFIQSTKLSDVVIGLSGGIDSSLSAALCVKALGKEKVHGVMLPYRTSLPSSLHDAKLVADWLQLDTEVIEITNWVDPYFSQYAKEASPLRRGNWMARARMCVLYDLSSRYEALVVGTSNRSELYTGYCTQYGDSACAFEPIGHLYKTEVRAMSRMLGMPTEIIEKRPTADLWAEQTDENELGVSYQLLDEILWLYLDCHLSHSEITAKGIRQEDVDRVMHLMKSSEFKRKLPEAMAGTW